MLLHPIVRQHLERIELEGAERLALELGRRVEARLRHQHATLDAAAGDDLDRRAGVIQRHETGVGHQPGIHLPGAQEGHLLGKGRSGHEVEDQPVLLRRLHRIGQVEVEVAKAGSEGGTDVALGRLRAMAATHHHNRAEDGALERGTAAERSVPGGRAGECTGHLGTPFPISAPRCRERATGVAQDGRSAASIQAAAVSTSRSAKRRPTICSPTGSPPAPVPQGMLTAGVRA